MTPTRKRKITDLNYRPWTFSIHILHFRGISLREYSTNIFSLVTEQGRRWMFQNILSTEDLHIYDHWNASDIIQYKANSVTLIKPLFWPLIMFSGTVRTEHFCLSFLGGRRRRIWEGKGSWVAAIIGKIIMQYNFIYSHRLSTSDIYISFFTRQERSRVYCKWKLRKNTSTALYRNLKTSAFYRQQNFPFSIYKYIPFSSHTFHQHVKNIKTEIDSALDAGIFIIFFQFTISIKWL